MTIKNWKCPYCTEHATVSDDEYSYAIHQYKNKNNCTGMYLKLTSQIIICPNEKCKQLTVTSYFSSMYPSGQVKSPLGRWQHLPNSSAKPMPDYIPAGIREDYEEACTILNDSPKAAATLSRRCLEGILADFHGLVEGQHDIKRQTLYNQINALRKFEHVDPEDVDSIDAVRRIGNINTHMQQDANILIDATVEESSALIELIEMLLEDWYIQRHKRRVKRDNLIKRADDKEAAEKEQKIATKELP